jgi:cobalt-zinc-cadmium efflux system outer membrane protein
MFMRLAATAAWFAAMSVAQAAAAAEPLTLDDAFDRVAASHPALRLDETRAAILAAERDRAALHPALTAGVQLENAPGTGAYEGVRGGETTLTLASVLEPGGKADARRALAQSRLDALAVEHEARRLDLLAEVARRYLVASVAQQQREIATQDIAQRQRAAAAAQAQLQAGAAPESVLLAARAALALAELALARTGQQWMAARAHLAALWGERTPAFDLASTDPLDLPAIQDTAALAELLDRTPELTRFASASRIAEARLQLARAAATADLEWQLGLRHHRQGGDVALVAGLSVPLGTRRRAEPEVRAAGAELAALEIERESASLALYSTLAEAHGRYTVAQVEVARLRDEVLPLLARAEIAAERAWRAGATGHLEWAQLQSEFTATRRRQLDIALDAQRALIEIQRLTGQAFLAGPTNTQDAAP